MTLLEKHVWKSHIRVDTKVRLYQTYVLPVLMYGSEAWTITKDLAWRLDAFDTWSLRKILLIPYTRHVINASVRKTTSCHPVSSIIKTRRLHFFGHKARSDSRQDHQRAVSASLRPSRVWRRLQGCPSTTWLRGVKTDVQLANIGIHSSRRKVNDRVLWRRVSSTWQHSIRGTPPKKKNEETLQRLY